MMYNQDDLDFIILRASCLDNPRQLISEIVESAVLVAEREGVDLEIILPNDKILIGDKGQNIEILHQESEQRGIYLDVIHYTDAPAIQADGASRSTNSSQAVRVH